MERHDGQVSGRAQLFSLGYVSVSQAIGQDISLKTTEGDSVNFASLSSIEKKVKASLPAAHSKADQSICNRGDYEALGRLMEITNQIRSRASIENGVQLSAEERAFLGRMPNCGLYGSLIEMLPLTTATQLMYDVPTVSNMSAIDGADSDCLDLSTAQDQHFRFRLSG